MIYYYNLIIATNNQYTSSVFVHKIKYKDDLIFLLSC